MAGRHAYPLKVHEIAGKKHLTKKDKEQRKNSEVLLPDGDIICPEYIKTNIQAVKKWDEVVSILSSAKILKPADAGSIARYCMAHSEYLDLLQLRESVATIEEFSMKEEFDIADEFENNVGAKAAAKMWKKVEFIFSSQAVLNVDKAINQKMQVILQLEDHLFLNILSRVKNILQKKEPEEADESKKMFG